MPPLTLYPFFSQLVGNEKQKEMGWHSLQCKECHLRGTPAYSHPKVGGEISGMKGLNICAGETSRLQEVELLCLSHIV